MRRSIHIEGFNHGKQPIPAASRVGNIVTTGGVHGMDRSTGVIPADGATQVRNAFANLKAILAAAGASPDQIVKLTVFMKGPEIRDLVNEQWTALFPDPASRPARHSLNYDLNAPQVVQLEALAVLD
jgi:enamine deaminase RidA (YjgF/YER057c/UK114 family)